MSSLSSKHLDPNIVSRTSGASNSSETGFAEISSRVIDVPGNQLRIEFASLPALRTSCASFLYNLGLQSTLKPQCGEVCFIVKSGIGLGDLRLCLL